MNYIYDIVLNFNKDYLDYYEWNKSDTFTYIDKIHIYVVNDTSMNDIYNSSIKIDKSLLDEIYNKTYTNKNKIKYSLLVTDRNRVIALMFDDNGFVMKKSSLLIDEEDAVIEESNLYTLDIFNYEIINSITNNLFLTRLEKYIKNSLLEEINYLYNNKIYDELNYLYYEIYNDNVSIKYKYKRLLNIIDNNNFDKLNYLYEIIKLTKEKSY